MRLHHSLLLCAMGLLAVAHPRAAWADPLPATPETAAMTEKARQLYDEGLAAFKKGKVAEAHASYLAAWSLNKHWQIAANLADTEIDLGEYRQAAEHATYYRANSPANRKERAEALLKRALERVAVLTITVEPAGADVLVDGMLVGTAPLPQSVFLDPGKHTVTARLAGRPDVAQDVTVGAGTSETASLKFVQESAPQPPPPPPPLPVTTPGPNKGIIIAGASLTGAALVAGVVLTVVANSKASDAATDRTALMSSHMTCTLTGATPACAALSDATDARAAMSNAALWSYVGAGVLGAGTLVYALVPRKAAPTMGLRVAPIVGARRGGLLVEGAW